MARIRSLKPEAFQSETLSRISIEAERTFFGLSTQADDRGRFRWQPKTLNGILWSERGNHSVGEFDIELKELLLEGALCRYVGCDGKSYGHLIAWDTHQRVDKPTPSRIPPCLKHPSGVDSKDRCLFHEDSCPGPPPTQERSESPTGVLATDLEVEVEVERDLEVEVERDHPAKPPVREDAENLCNHLADRVEANGAKRPLLNARARKAAVAVIDIDKRPLEQAHRLIDWCMSDSFWHRNVLSMPKFRDKYDQLLLAAKAETARGPTRNHAAERNGAHVALVHELEAERLEAESQKAIT